jgi:hypothetical protein
MFLLRRLHDRRGWHGMGIPGRLLRMKSGETRHPQQGGAKNGPRRKGGVHVKAVELRDSKNITNRKIEART